jgi:phage terminase large subunit GpA-like protein
MTVTYGASPVADWLATLRPMTRLKPSEWAERYRKLPEASAARGARWNNTTAPYLTEIMDTMIEPGITQISVMKAAQVGLSEAMLTVLGYHIEHRPTPMLWVCPTAQVASDFSKERCGDMILSTSALRRLVSDKRLPARDERPESTLQPKVFPCGFLALGGSNTPNTFARWAVRIAVGDDVDRWPARLGEGGDPGRLLVNRTTSFPDPLVVFISTPTAARGRIATLHEQGDRRRYHVTCPACGFTSWLTWSDPARFFVKFEDRTPATARLRCPCGYEIREPERRALIAAGRWTATATPLVPGHRSYHVPALLSPFVTLSSLVATFLSSRNEGPWRLKEFINTQLAEGWEDPRERVDPAVLESRLEDF